MNEYVSFRSMFFFWFSISQCYEVDNLSATVMNYHAHVTFRLCNSPKYNVFHVTRIEIFVLIEFINAERIFSISYNMKEMLFFVQFIFIILIIGR